MPRKLRLRMGAEHYCRERAETAEAKAQRIAEQELKRLRGSAQGLESHRKGDKRKLRIARRFREETTMTLTWIARRLRMESKIHLTQLLCTGSNAGRARNSCQY